MSAQYTITGQPLIHFRDAAGVVVEGREIDFRDAVTGRHGRIRVPLSQYTAERVNQLVMAQLQVIRAVESLGGSGAGG